MMANPQLAFIVALLAIILNISNLNAQQSIDSVPNKKLKVLRFSIEDEIAPKATRITSKAIEHGIQVKADIILLNLNTYGGLVSDADSIRTKILNSKIPVYVFIENNAASAGALISIACHKIIMRKGSTIGAASVVNEKGEKMPDKYQSYMRSKMRATAEVRGRNPQIAEAMVDGDIQVAGLNDSGKVVTLTASEAIKWGYCDLEAETPEIALEKLGITDYTTETFELGTVDKMISWLTHPGVSGILILIILGGIYFELQSPGIGFPLLASGIAALLYFAPLYLEGFALYWEIILFGAGLILLAVEILIIPGFGVAGISGIILTFTGLVLSMVNNFDFNFDGVGLGQFNTALLTVFLALLAFVVLVVVMGSSVYNFPFFQRIMLKDNLADAKVDIQGNSYDENDGKWIGEIATVYNDLKPKGKIQFKNRLLNATSYGTYIEKGKQVEIVQYFDGVYWVKKPD